MKFSATFITIVTPPMLESPVLRVLPPIIFEERFERNGKWLLGPNIIASIVRHTRGKSLIARFDRPYQLTITLPKLPTVLNEINNKYVDIFWSIPEELRPTFETCCLEVCSVLADEIDHIKAEFINTAATAINLSGANMILRNFENRRIAAGDSALWQILSECCGINPLVALGISKPFINMHEEHLKDW